MLNSCHIITFSFNVCMINKLEQPLRLRARDRRLLQRLYSDDNSNHNNYNDNNQVDNYINNVYNNVNNILNDDISSNFINNIITSSIDQLENLDTQLRHYEGIVQTIHAIQN